MNHSFSSSDLATVWLGGLALGGLTLFFVHLLRDAGVTLEVSPSTRRLFAVVAWGSWALNAGAVALLSLQELFGVSLSINPWAVGAAVSPMAIPVGLMYQVLRGSSASSR
jgi:hypothetical protein